MKTRVYLSRSFSKNDGTVIESVRDILADESLADALGVETFDSESPRGGRLSQKIKSDIAASDVVLCLFTRRHGINGSDEGFAPPAYVCSEGAYADALGKRVLLWLEEGIEPKEMGLLHSKGEEHFRFSREELDTHAFRKRALGYLKAQIKTHHTESVREHIFREYVLHLSLYPDGYLLAHHKLKVRVNKKYPITHHMVVEPSPSISKTIEVPGGAKLLDVVSENIAVPYPHTPFASFASADGVKFSSTKDSNGRVRIRKFQATFPKAGREYRYQWMWGSHGVVDPSRKIEFFRIAMSQRAVLNPQLLLRVHNSVNERMRPAVASIGGDIELPDDLDDRTSALESLYDQGVQATDDQVETTPLFTCYRFDAFGGTAKDLLLLF
jgi:hypothetical protein